MSSFLFAQQFPAPGAFTIQGEAIYLLPNVGSTFIQNENPFCFWAREVQYKVKSQALRVKL